MRKTQILIIMAILLFSLFPQARYDSGKTLVDRNGGRYDEEDHPSHIAASIGSRLNVSSINYACTGRFSYTEKYLIVLSSAADSMIKIVNPTNGSTICSINTSQYGRPYVVRVGEFDGDLFDELCVLIDNSTILIMDEDGAILGDIDTGLYLDDILISDLDGDGVDDIVAYSRDTHTTVVVVNGTALSIVDSITVSNYVIEYLSLGDYDGDGVLDLYICQRRADNPDVVNITVFSIGDFSILLTRNYSLGARKGYALENLNDDPQKELIIVLADSIIILNSSMDIAFYTNISSDYVFSGVYSIDDDQDNISEVFISCRNGSTYYLLRADISYYSSEIFIEKYNVTSIFEPDFQFICVTENADIIVEGMWCIVNVTNNSGVDLLALQPGGRAFIYDLQGEHIVESVYVDGYVGYASAFVISEDFNGDTRKDILVVANSTRRSILIISDVNAPRILSINTNAGIFIEGETLEIEINVRDEHDILWCNVSLISGEGYATRNTSLRIVPISEDIFKCIGEIPDLPPGNFTLSVTIADSYYNTKTYTDKNYDVPHIQVIGYVYTSAAVANIYYSMPIYKVDLDGDTLDELILIYIDNNSMLCIDYVDINGFNISIQRLASFNASGYPTYYFWFGSVGFSRTYVIKDINGDNISDIIILLTMEQAYGEAGYRTYQYIVSINGSLDVPQISISNITDWREYMGTAECLRVLRIDSEEYVTIVAWDGIYFLNGTPLYLSPAGLELVDAMQSDVDSAGYIFALFRHYYEYYIDAYYLARINITDQAIVFFYTIDIPSSVSWVRSVAHMVKTLNGIKYAVFLYEDYDMTQILEYYLFDCMNLSKVVSNELGSYWLYSIMDINNDSQDEIIITSSSALNVYDPFLNDLLSIDLRSNSVPVVARWDCNELYDIIIMYENTMLLYVDANVSNMIKISTHSTLTHSSDAYLSPAHVLDIPWCGDQIVIEECLQYDSYTYLLEIVIVNNVEFYRIPQYAVDVGNDVVVQGDAVGVKLNVFDAYGNAIIDGDTRLLIDNSTSYLVLTPLGNGSYIVDVPTIELSLGPHLFTIEFTHDRFQGFHHNITVVVLGELDPIIYVPQNVSQGANLTLIIALFDSFHNPVGGCNVSIVFFNASYKPTAISYNEYVLNILNISVPIGSYVLYVYINHQYAVPLTIRLPIRVSGGLDVDIAIVEPELEIVQGDSFTLAISVRDEKGYSIDDATVSVMLHGKEFGAVFNGSGVYISRISTHGVPAGEHKVYVYIHHPVVGTVIEEYNVTIVGLMDISFSFDNETLYQDEEYTLRVSVLDIFGYSVENASVYIEIHNISQRANEISPGVYEARISFSGFHHGKYLMFIYVEKEYYQSKVLTATILLKTKMPKLTITTSVLLEILAISLIASFVGLAIYLWIARKTRVIHEDPGAIRGIARLLNIVYIVVFTGFLVSVYTAEYVSRKGQYTLAMGLASLALIISILLTAIWTYKDLSLIIITEKYSRRGFLFCLWHLAIAPILLLLIFRYGLSVEWFYVHVVEDIIVVYDYQIPKLLISVMGVYVSSFAIIVVKLYREALKTLGKIRFMRYRETPESVIVNEKVDSINRMTNSMRIKFLMFLAVVGATVVSTTKLVQYYAIGLVVILPILIIVVIPYITLRLLLIVGKISREIRKHIPH